MTDFVAWKVVFEHKLPVMTCVMHGTENDYPIWSTWLCCQLFLITVYSHQQPLPIFCHLTGYIVFIGAFLHVDVEFGRPVSSKL